MTFRSGKVTLEPSVEPCFDQDSYGYRPNRSASDALAKARERFHYTFDKWMRIHYPNIPFERYADDTILAERSDPKVMSVHKELSVKSRVRGDFHARFCERVRVILL